MMKDLFRLDFKHTLQAWDKGFAIDESIAPIDKIIIEVPFNGKESLTYWLIASAMFFRKDRSIEMTPETVLETIDEIMKTISINPDPSILSPEIPLWKYHLILAEQSARRFGFAKNQVGSDFSKFVIDFISEIIHVWCFLGGESAKSVKPIFAVPEGWTLGQINESITNQDFYLTFIGTEEPTELEEE